MVKIQGFLPNYRHKAEGAKAERSWISVVQCYAAIILIDHRGRKASLDFSYN